MNRAIFLAGLLSLTMVLQACMGDPPKMSNRSDPGSSPDATLLVNKNKCTGGNQVLASLGGAHFNWSARKGVSADTAVDIPVVGTTDMAGCIYTKGLSLNGGSARIDFRPETTNSFSFIRDNRIIQYIFGYELPDAEGSASNNPSTGILQFNTQSITRIGGTDLTLPAGVGDTIALKVTGVLLIAGIKVPVEVPVALTKTDKGYNAVNSDVWQLNVRGGTPATNTLGLDKRVTEILALVVNGTLQDMIDVKFNVDFVNLCSP